MTSTPHEEAARELQEFLRIIAKLRDPQGGCPWDIKQTFASLKPLLIEEAYEVADAVESGDAGVCEELGDLLSLVALFAQIAEERSAFSFASILQGISSKLVRRHPHVFGDVKAETEEEVLRNWEAIKQQERKDAEKESAQEKGLLDGLPRSLPGLQRAHQIGTRCARVGFDWSSSADVAEKVREELNEFLDECAKKAASTPVTPSPPADALVEEFGDLLFSLAQYSRHLGFNAEEALAAANNKFLKRYRIVEDLAKSETGNRSIAGLSADKMQELWVKAKTL
jgi:ATP diphosphatase